VGAFGAGLSNAVTAVIDKLKIFGGKLGSVLKGAMGMVGWIAGGLTTVVGGLIGIVEQLGDSFFDMYDTGINFAKGLDDSQTGLGAMANAAANARLTIGEFAEFITENSRVAVAIGAESMGALSNSVRGALYPLGNLGLTAAETNEHLGEYLEVQRTLGVLDTMSRSQRARASSEYLVQLTMMAQITGKRRKQIAADMKQAMDQTSLTAWMLTLSAEEKQQALKNTQAITGVLASIDPAAGAAFNEALGKGGMGLTDWGRSLMQAGYTNEVAALDNLRLQVERGEITEQQAQKETLRIMRMMRDNEGAAQALRELARTGDGAADQAVKLISGLQGAELSMDAWSKRLGGAEKGIGSWDEMQRSVSQTWTNFIAGLFGDDDFSEGINAFMGEFQKILAPDGDFAKTIATFARDAGPALVKAIQSLGNAMPDVVSWIKKLPDTLKSLWDSLSRGIAAVRSIFFDQVYNIDTGETEWVAKDMGKVMDEMWGKITDKLVKGAKNLPWGKIAIAIAGIFAGKAFLGMIGRKMMGGGVGGGVAAPALGAEQTKGGSLGKNVGGFVGGIAEGVMKGAAAGLAAFGKAGPVVIKGAAILGASIAAIALGIAGAQWILSKTMGPFADSLKGFAELDGVALIKTGLGMSAIGIGLGMLGAGGVINAVGNLVGAGFEALGNLLGVKGPLERLREFGEAGKDIDAEGV
ncbi:MAG: hypothetical protein QF535_19055, partial [Anaerolineales bacterium]|nr:hypothetical protein [Anaerolineales bacterium]